MRLLKITLVFLVSLYLIEAQNSYECEVILAIDNSMPDRGCQMDQTLPEDEVKYYSCDSLDTMLEFVSSEEIDADLNCTELWVAPGEHNVTQNYTFTGKSMRIIRDPLANYPAQISFNIDQAIINRLDKLEPLYVWIFDSSEIVEIRGLSFVYSPGIILATNVSYATFEDNEFLYFIESALDIYNSPHVDITNCTFKHCGYSANILKSRSYSIHAGAVSIAVDEFSVNLLQPSYISVNRSNFYNNSAIPSLALTRSTNDIFSRQIFTGRGGGLGMAVNSPDQNIEITIVESLFEQNQVQLWGGGAYIIFGVQSNHTAVVKRSAFVRNKSYYGAGGYFLGVFSGGYPDKHSTSNVIDCDFIENHAVHGAGSVWPVAGPAPGAGGGIFNRGKYEGCRFINNSAENFGALSLVTGDAYRSQISHTPVEIINCTFFANDGGTTPAFSALYIPTILSGNIVFDFNNGGALQLVGSTTAVKGIIEIKNSNVIDSRTGALTMSSFAQLTLYRGARMIFVNNTGSIGAALVSEAVHISRIFTGIAFNPLCFLLYEDLRLSPNDWKDVEMMFAGNTAIVGAAILTSQLSICSWTQFKNPYFNASAALRWDFITFGENTNTFHETDSKSPTYYVQTSGQNVMIANENITVYPGEEFMMNVAVTDELGHPVFSAIRTRDPITSSSDLHSSFIFDPNVHAVRTRSDNIFAVPLVHYDFSLQQVNNPIDIQNIEDSIQLDTNILSSLTITFTECPPGFLLQTETADFRGCRCNSNNPLIVTCENGTTVFQENLWATTDEMADDNLFTYPCPIGYCKCTEQEGEATCYNRYDYQDPDQQCISERKGTLCGECRSDSEGVSVLLDKCVTCHDGYSTLIPLLVIADVIVLVVLIRYFLCHQYPSWILPCIFYIQFLPIGSVALSRDVNYFRPYLLYVSSAMSFYFPNDFCLYHNMDALVSYFLRFIPFFTIAITLPLVIIYCWHVTNLASNKDWYLMWILLLLNYQFTLYTSMSILNCPSIPTSNGLRGFWFINGSVQCFTGGHIPLALFAILIIIILVSLIPLTFLLSLKIFEQPIWLKRIQRPLLFWYKEEFKWWFSIELARRFLLVLMIVPFNGSSYPVIITYCVTFGLFAYAQPYKSFYANLIEVIFSIVTMMLYNFQGLLSGLESVNSESTVIVWISGILYYIPFIVTLPLIVVHICFETKRRFLKFKQKRALKRKKRAETRHYSLATEINRHSVATSSSHDARQFIGSTIIEADDDNDNQMKYSMEMMSVVVTTHSK